jgi:hypothetical protein
MKTQTSTKIITKTHVVIATLVLLAIGWIIFAILPTPEHRAVLLTGKDLTEVTSLGGTDCGQYADKDSCVADRNCLWEMALVKGAEVAGGSLSVGADRCVLNIGELYFRGFNLSAVAEAQACTSGPLSYPSTNPLSFYSANWVNAKKANGENINLKSSCVKDTLKQFLCLKDLPIGYLQCNSTGLIKSLYDPLQHGNFVGVFDYNCPAGCQNGKCLISTTPPQATKNIYYVSSTGDDNNPGTLAAPKLNINLAIYNAVPPAIVYVLPGEYYNLKDPRSDFFISLKDNVDLICTATQKCVIYGGIYGASNLTLEGFSLQPMTINPKNPCSSPLTSPGQNCETFFPTNEFNFGAVLRFGSPTSCSISYPIKTDLYSPGKIENVVIKNNYIYNGMYRIQNSTNLTLEGNSNKIDKGEQNWGIQLFWGNYNINIRNNNLQSGNILDKYTNEGDRPQRAAGILVRNSQNVLIENNTINVRLSEKGTVTGYGFEIYDSTDQTNKTPKSSNITFKGNSVTGSYIKILKDYTKEYCGNKICEEDEISNLAYDFQYSCPGDCCGNRKCDSGEINTSQANKGIGGYVCDIDCPVVK